MNIYMKNHFIYRWKQTYAESTEVVFIYLKKKRILTSGFRLLIKRTEWPGMAVIPGYAIRPVIAEVVRARGPRAPCTPETERPAKQSRKNQRLVYNVS